MNAAMIIHTRTLYNDFHPELLVKPDDFTIEKVRWARDYILKTTAYSDDLKGIRQVVFNDKEHCVFGIVGILSGLFHEYKSGQYMEYAYDQNGRDIKCFLGYCVKKNEMEKGEIPDFQTTDFVELFIESVINGHIWESKEQKQLISSYKHEVKRKFYECSDMNPAPLEHTVGNAQNLCDYALARCIQGDNVWLCTNVCHLLMLKKGKMKMFTASSYTLQDYERWKKEVEDKDNSFQSNDNFIAEQSTIKKKDVCVRNVLIGGIVLIIIVVIILILKER